MYAYVYEYYTEVHFADSYEEACEYFASQYEDFDEDEVWLDSDECEEEDEDD